MTHRLLLSLTALAVAGIAVAQTPPRHAQPSPPATPSAPGAVESEADRSAVIERLAVAIDENFVFPDIAHRYAARCGQRRRQAAISISAAQPGSPRQSRLTCRRSMPTGICASDRPRRRHPALAADRGG